MTFFYLAVTAGEIATITFVHIILKAMKNNIGYKFRTNKILALLTVYFLLIISLSASANRTITECDTLLTNKFLVKSETTEFYMNSKYNKHNTKTPDPNDLISKVDTTRGDWYFIGGPCGEHINKPGKLSKVINNQIVLSFRNNRIIDLNERIKSDMLINRKNYYNEI